MGQCHSVPKSGGYWDKVRVEDEGVGDEGKQVEDVEPEELQQSNGLDSHSPGGVAKLYIQSSSPSQLR